MGSVGTAHATASASASIGTVSITLIDLDPFDNIAPALTFLNEQSSSYSQVDAPYVWDSDYAAGIYAPTSASVANALGSGSGSTDAGGAQGATTLLGSAAAGAGNYSGGSGNFYADFEVTPWTGVILTTSYAVAASTTVGFDAGNSEYASGNVNLSLNIYVDDGYESHTSYRSAFASYLWDGLVYSGESRSASGQLRLTYANLSADALSGYYYAQAYTYAGTSIAAAVPEPGTYAILLAGLAGIGIVVRRRRD